MKEELAIGQLWTDHSMTLIYKIVYFNEDRVILEVENTTKLLNISRRAMHPYYKKLFTTDV